ncbi:MAG: pantoate--beta-alanine ligase [Bacteroidales bacterium]
MKIVTTVKELQKLIKNSRLSPVGFVPTMGALHQGHLSLVYNAMMNCPVIVISIYVNPTQFNDKEDLRNYPRTPDEDLSMLSEILRKDDMIFTPTDKEIYPVEDKRQFNFGNLDRVMEAAHRPGHFNGVGQVVSRLFEIVKPDYAYFGLKDFQQLAVIKELVRQSGDQIRIVGIPIMRDEDGLAMSSRNRLLEPGIRKNAGIIYKTINAASEMIRVHEIQFVKNWVRKTIGNISGFEVEYFEIVDDTHLMPVESRDEIKKGTKYFGCIAVRAGKIRLIDNIEIPLNQSNS